VDLNPFPHNPSSEHDNHYNLWPQSFFSLSFSNNVLSKTYEYQFNVLHLVYTVRVPSAVREEGRELGTLEKCESFLCLGRK
jgi:hypothetical protein